MNKAAIIEAEELSTLIPHSGNMCLLDSVLAWDEQHIECLALSHCSLSNPLRDDDKLPIHAGVEYAAQAMAVHGELCKPTNGRPIIGYLAVLTNVEWYCSRLDNLSGELQVMAERLMAADGGFSYQFQLFHQNKLLLEGRALVALDRDVGR